MRTPPGARCWSRSTAMVLDGTLVTHPSDATGERPVGDAIYVR
ncbi:phosphodiester glycosidase family protein [Arsenicicoccus piscis]|nr:phosphodiester glycosidase family protein [Arsenicicoccus piscis]MCH8628751.1 phosphodiester glycosidase family protein [Arsenicicoccus piscis]